MSTFPQAHPQNGGLARVLILVKALPQPSKKYGETVCCAGITAEGVWRRLFPIRFRHLSGDSAFKRWDWVQFQSRPPTHDRRTESRHVYEDSLKVVGSLAAKSERQSLLLPLMRSSALDAGARGESLALVRPRNTRFHYRKRSAMEIASMRAAFHRAASQASLFDQVLAEMEPSPFDFRFKFEDSAGAHDHSNGDWETHAMFFRERQRHGEERALHWMSGVFNDEYPRKGMVFALGNQAARPRTWQLLGVVRLDDSGQLMLGL